LITALSIYCLASSDFIVNYGIEFYPLGVLAILISLGIVTYAILKYRLMDITIALTRAGIFAIVYTLVLGLPFWLGYATKAWFPATSLAVILATIGPFIYSCSRTHTKFLLTIKDNLIQLKIQKNTEGEGIK